MYILDEEEQELASTDTVSRDSQSLAVITLVQDLLHEAAAKAHNSRYNKESLFICMLYMFCSASHCSVDLYKLLVECFLHYGHMTNCYARCYLVREVHEHFLQ
jgi:hypothetical protein